jgi:hypothetical protein
VATAAVFGNAWQTAAILISDLTRIKIQCACVTHSWTLPFRVRFFLPTVMSMRKSSRDSSSLASLFLDFVQTKLMLRTCNCCFLLDFHGYIYEDACLDVFISSRFVSVL